MSYNLTAVGNGTEGVSSMLQLVNAELMFGYLGILLLLSIATIMFMAFTSKNPDNIAGNLTATAFISFLLSVLLGALNLVPDTAIYICFVLAAGLVASTIKKG